MEELKDERPQTRDEIMLGAALRNVGKVVLINDRDDVVQARQHGTPVIPKAAIVTAVCLDRAGMFTGLDLAVFDAELGYQIRRNVPPSPPSEEGSEPGYFESIFAQERQRVPFAQLREIVAGGIAAELDVLFDEKVRELSERIAALEDVSPKLDANAKPWSGRIEDGLKLKVNVDASGDAPGEPANPGGAVPAPKTKRQKKGAE